MTAPLVLILDNGAYTIKAGFSGIDFDPRVYPNSIARSRAEKKVYVADEIDKCRDHSGIVYRRPFERGMLVNWDAEKIIWDRLFSKDVLNVNAPETSLLVTEPYFNLPNIAETYDQMVFEEWEFQSYYRCTPASLAPYGGLFSNESDIPPACCIILDVGYSSSHVLPVKNGQIIWEHVKRIDVGGKLLTNHLKHLISFRQWNMADETHVVNEVKEACCYVSLDWKRDVEICKVNPKSNSIVQEYVLPDHSGSTSTTGYIRSGPNAETREAGPSKKGNEDEEEQVLWMGNERFMGPELLFNPSDIGLNQLGLSDTIAEVISEMPEELRGMYWANIGILGGLGYVEALGERLEQDLRALCPCDYEIGIFEAFDPPSVPYTSAVSLTTSEFYHETYPVTRAEYLEHGSSICRRRFGGPAYNVAPPGFLEGETGGDVSDDERERRYALGLESIRGKGSKGKRKQEEQEVTSGNWGGRRRRAGGLL